MFDLIGRWFEPVQTGRTYSRADHILLLILIAAGAWLRFWNLGGVGLHGDEDLMGLAARGIVEHGTPILPSGMVYTRALVHTYLLAASTTLLGDTEWALRLPSAIVGSLCGVFAFFMGRRFLDPKPNLAFVALISFLPAMIEMAQTARMYVFLVAGLLLFGCALFRWERTRTVGSLILALLAYSFAAAFHALAAFAVPLFLYPGLANRSLKQLLQGGVCAVVAAGIYLLIGAIYRVGYPDSSERMDRADEITAVPVALFFQGSGALAVAAAFAVAVAIIMIGFLRVERSREALPATLILALGGAACAVLHYHIGVLALLLGGIAWLRASTGRNFRLLLVGLLVGLLALGQLYFLHSTGEFPGRKIIGAMVGQPSVWPMIMFATFSPLGVAVVGAALFMAALRLASGRAVPVHFLYLAMAVWAPLFAIGFFKWDVPPRYTTGALAYFLLAVTTGATYLARNVRVIANLQEQRPAVAALAAFAALTAVVNPVAAWQMARNDYRTHPDHAGAAQFIRSQNPGPSDIIIAEDCINQTYYLGKVDYRLQNVVGAINHSVLRDGVLYGQYTGAPVIESGRDLAAILDREHDGNVYIISSGQFSEGLARRNRGNGIAEVLASERLQVVYTGRDRKTVVWKRVSRSGEAHDAEPVALPMQPVRE